MASSGVAALSVILGFLVVIGMHWYYPQNSLSQIVEQATIEASSSEAFAMGPILSFSMGVIIEYFIVVFAIYLFFRSVVKSFGHS
jgi:ABC-type antimicrobial peptide transport system permease subunit